ncbi:MAG TPA: hypothetical protein VNU94_04750 [Acidobacteriaceae bacterium]|nr:hypothetical protein [Acidobacteriaceae bacterium]
MTYRSTGRQWIVRIFWLFAFAAIPVWIHTDPGAWDLHIYLRALHSLQAGHDPYADGIAVQQAFHAEQALHPSNAPPYTYVYSPITLPLLRAIGNIPGWFSGSVYWLLYVAGVLAAIWVGMQAATPDERRFFVFIAPAAAFFPGLLVQDIILSGNVVFLVYGLIFATAMVGWRRGEWRWFYLTVLAASCCKAPLLSLLPIPILLARKQWIPACVTGAAGIALFAVQPIIWPTLFHSYLKAVELQFSYNQDFGFSPAGLLGYALAHFGVSYSPATTIFYLLYALPLFGLLLYLSRQFLGGRFSLQQWMPVMLLGVFLLNPRVMIYDVSPLMIPMALIVWRFFASLTAGVRAIVSVSLFFVLINAFILVFSNILVWKSTDGVLLVLIFAAGCWNLLRPNVPDRGEILHACN